MLSIKIPSFVPDIDALDINTQFLLSVSRGLLPNVLKIIESSNANFNPLVTNEYGMNAIHICCFCGFEEILLLLLNKLNIPINALDNLTRHALHITLQRGHFNLANIIYAKTLSDACINLMQLPDFITINYLDIFGSVQDLSFVNKYTPKVSMEPVANRILEASQAINI